MPFPKQRSKELNREETKISNCTNTYIKDGSKNWICSSIWYQDINWAIFLHRLWLIKTSASEWWHWPQLHSYILHLQAVQSNINLKAFREIVRKLLACKIPKYCLTHQGNISNWLSSFSCFIGWIDWGHFILHLQPSRPLFVPFNCFLSKNDF